VKGVRREKDRAEKRREGGNVGEGLKEGRGKGRDGIRWRRKKVSTQQ
jgi:hypothetical protein